MITSMGGGRGAAMVGGAGGGGLGADTVMTWPALNTCPGTGIQGLALQLWMHLVDPSPVVT